MAETRLPTRRELQVMDLLSRGRSGRGIADELGIANKTVQVHVYNLVRKIGARGQAHAVRILMESGLLSADRSTA